MQKFIPIALLAILVVGCKGGGTTAATTGGGSGTSTAGAGKTYTFKLSPKQGDKFSYLMKVDGGPNQQMEMNVSVLCEKVEGDKTTLVTSLDSVKMNGQEPPTAVLDSMKSAKATIELDSTGKTLSAKSENPMLSSFAGANFPGNAVKVGDEWEGTSGADGKETKAKYKFAKVESSGGKEIAVLEVTPESMDSVTLDGPIIVKVDASNGMTHSMSMKGKAKGADGKETPVSMELTPK